MHEDRTQNFCHDRAWTPAPSSQTFWHLPPPVSWSRRRSASWPGPGPRGAGTRGERGYRFPNPRDSAVTMGERAVKSQVGPAPDPPQVPPQDPPQVPPQVPLASIGYEKPRTKLKTPPLALPDSDVAEAKKKKKTRSLWRRLGLGLKPRSPKPNLSPAPTHSVEGSTPAGAKTPLPAPLPSAGSGAAPAQAPPRARPSRSRYCRPTGPGFVGCAVVSPTVAFNRW